MSGVSENNSQPSGRPSRRSHAYARQRARTEIRTVPRLGVLVEFSVLLGQYRVNWLNTVNDSSILIHLAYGGPFFGRVKKPILINPVCTVGLLLAGGALDILFLSSRTDNSTHAAAAEGWVFITRSLMTCIAASVAVCMISETPHYTHLDNGVGSQRERPALQDHLVHRLEGSDCGLQSQSGRCLVHTLSA
jgi:hypothetical protein